MLIQPLTGPISEFFSIYFYVPPSQMLAKTIPDNDIDEVWFFTNLVLLLIGLGEGIYLSIYFDTTPPFVAKLYRKRLWLEHIRIYTTVNASAQDKVFSALNTTTLVTANTILRSSRFFLQLLLKSKTNWKQNLFWTHT